MKASRLSLLCLLLACGCTSGEVQKNLGLNKVAPDEFTVVSRPPLSMPPEFELKPPRPGATGPAQPSTTEQAHKLLTGQDSPPASLDETPQASAPTAVTPVLTTEAPDGPTANFLSKLGADKADESIRDKLNEDAMVSHAAPSKTLYEEMVGSKDSAEPTVDAKKEAERLRNNKDSGKPANEGEVPTEVEKPKSVIDQIF